MKIDKKYLLLLLVMSTAVVNIPILAATNWTVNGNEIWSDGQVLVKAPNVGSEGSLRISSSTGGWSSDNLILSLKSNHALIETWAGTKPIAMQVASGRVGIGTTTPGVKFEVKGNNNLGNNPNVIASFRANDNAGVVLGSLNGNTPYIADDPGAGSSVGLAFFTNGQERMRIKRDNGNIGIGTSNPTQKLSVNGAILAKEVVVSLSSSNWPDYVFEEGYSLKPLSEVKDHIDEYKHLPNVPSAKDVEEKGISLGEMQKIQMEKIEELTLYIIELEDQINELKSSL